MSLFAHQAHPMRRPRGATAPISPTAPSLQELAEWLERQLEDLEARFEHFVTPRSQAAGISTERNGR